MTLFASPQLKLLFILSSEHVFFLLSSSFFSLDIPHPPHPSAPSLAPVPVFSPLYRERTQEPPLGLGALTVNTLTAHTDSPASRLFIL